MRSMTSFFYRTLLLAAAVLLFASASPGAVQAQEGDRDAEGQRIYVCNQGAATLSVIDVGSNEVVDRIDLRDLGFSPNAKPHHTVAEPDGSHWYVTLIGENRVLKFNRDNELVGQTEMEVPGLLSLHPTRDLLIVGRSMSAVNPPRSIALIRRSDMALQEEVSTLFARPHAIATTPDGSRTYVASLAENQILTFEHETGETDLTSFGGEPHVFVDFAISPDGNTMVATGQVSGKALILDISNPSTVSPDDTADVNAQPWHPVFSEDGSRVYFGNKETHTVTVLDMDTRTVEAVIEGSGLAQPHGSALSADGSYLYISNNNRQGTFKAGGSAPGGDPNGTVTVIDTRSLSIEKVIEVEAYPSGIGTRARW